MNEVSAALPPHADGAPRGHRSDGDACARHELLFGNLYADLAPWVDRRLRITEPQMRDAINFVDQRRGKWNSWVTDTLTPVLIKDGRVYLTLGPPVKDPTNYFWTVLADLQRLASTRRLPDTELLLNFADTPVVYAANDGSPTAPGLPVFSYCKRDHFLDVLVPGYYTPDRACKQYTSEHRAAARYPWRAKLRKAFARYTHFCKPQKQTDEYGRRLPPCARSYFAALAATAEGSAALDVMAEGHTQCTALAVHLPSVYCGLCAPCAVQVMPMNVVNDTKDPSLDYGRKLLRPGEGLPIAEHGKYAYVLDTDGFTSAYKLQQLLATDSTVLHHRSPCVHPPEPRCVRAVHAWHTHISVSINVHVGCCSWRAYFHRALHEFVHYVPLWGSSADDVLRLIDWLNAHDDVARRVALNGQHLACEHLTQPGRQCYWERAIREYTASFLDYAPNLASRPRAFPLDRLNLMCRIRDAPVVCYYNVRPGSHPLPEGYECEKPVPNSSGWFEECWYRGTRRPAVAV